MNNLNNMPNDMPHVFARMNRPSTSQGTAWTDYPVAAYNADFKALIVDDSGALAIASEDPDFDKLIHTHVHSYKPTV